MRLVPCRREIKRKGEIKSCEKKKVRKKRALFSSPLSLFAAPLAPKTLVSIPPPPLALHAGAPWDLPPGSLPNVSTRIPSFSFSFSFASLTFFFFVAFFIFPFWFSFFFFKNSWMVVVCGCVIFSILYFLIVFISGFWFLLCGYWGFKRPECVLVIPIVFLVECLGCLVVF